MTLTNLIDLKSQKKFEENMKSTLTKVSLFILAEKLSDYCTPKITECFISEILFVENCKYSFLFT